MNHLYHSVPKDLEGSILYPLNSLKDKFPDIYKREVDKYIGREYVREQRIPILNCLWNDVLHFSAVNPRDIKKALIEAGRNPDFTLEYYEIDPKSIEPQNAIVYLYSHIDQREKMSAENFIQYHPDEMAKFASIPQSTREYYKEIIDSGRRPLLYHGISHILFKGTIDITSLPVITV